MQEALDEIESAPSRAQRAKDGHPDRLGQRQKPASRVPGPVDECYYDNVMEMLHDAALRQS